MCAGAFSRMPFRRIVYGCRNDKFGGCGSVAPVLSTHQWALTPLNDAAPAAARLAAAVDSEACIAVVPTTPQGGAGSSDGSSSSSSAGSALAGADEAAVLAAAAAAVPQTRVLGGLFADAAVQLLRRFYSRGNSRTGGAGRPTAR